MLRHQVADDGKEKEEVTHANMDVEEIESEDEGTLFRAFCDRVVDQNEQDEMEQDDSDESTGNCCSCTECTVEGQAAGGASYISSIADDVVFEWASCGRCGCHIVVSERTFEMHEAGHHEFTCSCIGGECGDDSSYFDSAIDCPYRTLTAYKRLDDEQLRHQLALRGVSAKLDGGTPKRRETSPGISNNKIQPYCTPRAGTAPS